MLQAIQNTLGLIPQSQVKPQTPAPIRVAPQQINTTDKISLSTAATSRFQPLSLHGESDRTVDFLMDRYHRSRNSQDRIQIIQALGAVRSEGAASALAKIADNRLSDSEENAVVSALGNSRSAKGVEVLNQFYDKFWNRSHKRIAVIAALGNSRQPAALASLSKAYEDGWSRSDIRSATIHALGQTRQAGAVDILERIFEKSWSRRDERMATLNALGETRSAAGAEVLKDLYSKVRSRDEEYAIINALGHSRSGTGVAFLRHLYDRSRSNYERDLIMTAIAAAYKQDDN